jgi:hypothetical protein
MPQSAPRFVVLYRNGAAREIRTPDPIITNDVFYQLSYCGIKSGNALLLPSLFQAH